jgi:glutathione-specific gamma-glutamylcyclotransferase
MICATFSTTAAYPHSNPLPPASSASGSPQRGRDSIFLLAGEGGLKRRMTARRRNFRGINSSSAIAKGDLWVFGYGSLMWRPGFAFVERQSGLLRGYRRSLCIYSHVHRGTPEQPGLVLGLDRGGACHGAAFRIEANQREATLGYLREREQVTSVYLERNVPVLLPEGAMVNALTYVADRKHPQYAGALGRADLLRLTARAAGRSGRNADYILNTVAHLEEIGIKDPTLEWLADQLRRL